ncbi:MAG TPA: hypothetical protein EYP28_05110 [Methanophagales archaeon]|nr:hypothetical protein [Methanophagales archaeon]
MTKTSMIIVDQSCPGCTIKPDLAVKGITWSPDNICDGDQVAVNATIVNIGTAIAADFYVRYCSLLVSIHEKLLRDLTQTEC